MSQKKQTVLEREQRLKALLNLSQTDEGTRALVSHLMSLNIIHHSTTQGTRHACGSLLPNLIEALCEGENKTPRVLSRVGGGYQLLPCPNHYTIQGTRLVGEFHMRLGWSSSSRWFDSLTGLTPLSTARFCSYNQQHKVYHSHRRGYRFTPLMLSSYTLFLCTSTAS